MSEYVPNYQMVECPSTVGVKSMMTERVALAQVGAEPLRT